MQVEFLGDEHAVTPPDDLTFGRDADLIIGEENQFVHRLAGRFVWRHGLWWLQNLGSRLTLEVLGTDNDSRLRLGPGSERPLAVADGVVRFVAGRTTYELSVSVSTEFRAPDEVVAHAGLEGGTTIAEPALQLNEEQRLLLVCLAEFRLRDPHDQRLPSNKEVCAKLGWSKKKFDGKLDYLCGRLDALGVAGARGDVGSLAKDRRAVLVDHVLARDLISPVDLELLTER